jgi:ATP-dependent DNA ligase
LKLKLSIEEMHKNEVRQALPSSWILDRIPQCPGPELIVARSSTLPKRLQPMLATLTDAPFDAADWVFEDKYDGFRMVARVEAGHVTL